MNYEFQIRRLEAELAHVREMEAINRDHVNVLDTGHQYTGTRLAAIEAALETLTTNVTILAGKIDALVSALLREHPNGDSGRKS